MPRNDVRKDNFIIKYVEVSHKYTGQNILLPEVGRGGEVKEIHTVTRFKQLPFLNNLDQ